MTPEELPWCVLYTKPRNEKKVAERLTGAGYTVYCPLQKVRRQWSDRVKVVEEPLFKGYLFIKIEEKKTINNSNNTNINIQQRPNYNRYTKQMSVKIKEKEKFENSDDEPTPLDFNKVKPLALD